MPFNASKRAKLKQTLTISSNQNQTKPTGVSNFVATASSSHITSITPPQEQLWVDKYAPKSMDQLIGNSSKWQTLKNWLQYWPKNGKLIALQGNTSVGKCFSPSTKFMCYDGSRIRADKVTISTQLLGEDGTIRRVKFISSGFTPLMYDIIDRHEHKIIMTVTENHILVLCNPETPNQFQQITVKDYLNSSTTTISYMRRPSCLVFSNESSYIAKIIPTYNNDPLQIKLFAYQLGALSIIVSFSSLSTPEENERVFQPNISTHLARFYGWTHYETIVFILTHHLNNITQFYLNVFRDDILVRNYVVLGIIAAYNWLSSISQLQMEPNTFKSLIKNVHICRIVHSIGYVLAETATNLYRLEKRSDFVRFQIAVTRQTIQQLQQPYTGIEIEGDNKRFILAYSNVITHNSTAAHLVAKTMGYHPHSIDSSSTNTVDRLEEKLCNLLNPNFHHIQALKFSNKIPNRGLVILDEFDGVNFRNKGMSSYLLNIFDTTKVPIIVIYNEGNLKDSLKRVLESIKLKLYLERPIDKPSQQAIIQRCKMILQNENVSLSRINLDEFVPSFNGDIRNCINTLHLWFCHKCKVQQMSLTTNRKSLSLYTSLTQNIKDIFLIPFSFDNEQLHMYTHQYSTSIFYVHDQYLKTFSPSNRHAGPILSTLADSFSEGEVFSTKFLNYTDVDLYCAELAVFNQLIVPIHKLQYEEQKIIDITKRIEETKQKIIALQQKGTLKRKLKKAQELHQSLTQKLLFYQSQKSLFPSAFSKSYVRTTNYFPMPQSWFNPTNLRQKRNQHLTGKESNKEIATIIVVDEQDESDSDAEQDEVNDDEKNQHDDEKKSNTKPIEHEKEIAKLMSQQNKLDARRTKLASAPISINDLYILQLNMNFPSNTLQHDFLHLLLLFHEPKEVVNVFYMLNWQKTKWVSFLTKLKSTLIDKKPFTIDPNEKPNKNIVANLKKYEAYPFQKLG